MSLAESLAILLGGVALLNVLAAALTIAPSDFQGLRGRIREVWPYLAFLGGVLAVNRVARQLGPEVSWIIGWNITGLIYAIEGNFVPLLQTIATPALTAYFSASYLFGYVFLLTFPYVAYVALPDTTYLKRTAVAFGVNYAVGLLFYVLFISYGPRNLIPDLVDPLMYAEYPSAQVVTSHVNRNTNVFPSLHASLAVTVALQAWRTREIYPRWTAIAVPLAASVVFSTMYLGIHWGIDVVAGVLLGVGSLRAADHVVARTG